MQQNKIIHILLYLIVLLNAFLSYRHILPHIGNWFTWPIIIQRLDYVYPFNRPQTVNQESRKAKSKYEQYADNDQANRKACLLLFRWRWVIQCWVQSLWSLLVRVRGSVRRRLSLLFQGLLWVSDCRFALLWVTCVLYVALRPKKALIAWITDIRVLCAAFGAVLDIRSTLIDNFRLFGTILPLPSLFTLLTSSWLITF